MKRPALILLLCIVAACSQDATTALPEASVQASNSASHGFLAYVANFGSNSVSVIATSTNAVVATVAVGGSPEGLDITPKGDFAYVTAGLDNVAVIETSTNTVAATVAVGGRGVAITPKGDFAYVTNPVSHNVSVIEISTNTVVATVAVGSEPVGVAVTPAKPK